MKQEISSHKLREKYLRFFEEKGHVRIPSAPLVPEHDPTTLFIGSGMQPLVPYLLGEPHPQGTRLTNSQKCFRAEDIEEIGDNRHTTFFEMLGNWSLGDYFKEEQLPWFAEFLTDVAGIDPQRLYVSVFAGDEAAGVPRDEESATIWQKIFAQWGIEAKIVEIGSEDRGGEIGMQEGRIFYYDAAKNWWSRSGLPANMPVGEPGGPDSEVFYDFGTKHDPAFGEHCHPNCDCGRFMEIGNSVFMEYIKQEDGSFGKLPKQNVDFGGGLERITAAAADTPDVFRIDVFWGLIEAVQKLATTLYEENPTSYRIVVDHLRGAVFMIADGVLPSNTDQGYFVRRLLRRAVRHLDVLGVKKDVLGELASVLAASYSEAYPELVETLPSIQEAIQEEKEKFQATLQRGLKEFARLSDSDISGEDAFRLFSTFGFPLEMTQELAAEKGIGVDVEGFARKLAEHQELSREGAKQKFAGGLADHSEKSVQYHTATHLLHQALRDVLGDHVVQKGSNITPKRLRFDFSYPDKMTPEQIQQVEDMVNENIQAALPVQREEMSVEEAKQRGALGLFEHKYGDKVNVYSMGDYSVEICGGPHVERTDQLGKFRITKEQSASAGIRRIKAILE